MATTAPTSAALAAPATAAPSAAPASRFGALSQPKYRLFWLGSLAAVGGVQLVQVGNSWLVVKELGGSGTALGLVGAATAVPTIIINLFGGVLADRLDRKKILIATSLVAALLMAVQATLDITNTVSLWHVVVIAIGLGLVNGFDWPTRNAFFPQLIRRDFMASAVTLNTIMWQGTRIVVPAIGGVLIAVLGTESLFVASAAGFAAMVVVLFVLTVAPVPPRPRRSPIKDMGEGISYIWRTPLFRVLIPLTYANMFFGLQYITLMVLFADRFGVDSRAYGWMLTLMGIGAVAGTVAANRLQASRLLGTSMLGATLMNTIFLVAFSWSPGYWASLPFIFFASFFNAIYLVNSMTAMQLRVPDALRGRVMGMHGITFSLIPLGGLLGGAIADVLDVRWAVTIAALALTAIVGAVLITQRHIRQLDGRRMAERPAQA